MLSLVTSLQLGSIFAVFLIILGCCLLPLKLFRRSAKDGATSTKFKRGLALANCFAGGVFLGTCFIGLLPMVEEKFLDACREGGVVIHYPVAQTTVVLGFFLILFVEQTIHCVQSNRAKKDAHSTHVELNSLGEIKEERGYSASDEDSDGSEQEVLSVGDMEKQPLATKERKHRRKVAKKENGVKINKDDGHDHSHGHGHSHGHSHEDEGGHSHLTGVINEESSIRCIILLLALGLHSVFEGMALGLQDEFKVYVNLFIAVIVHECLCGLAMGISLVKHSLKTATVVKLSVFFSLTIPVGIGIGMGVDTFQGFGGLMASCVLQGIATGTFLYALFFEIVPCAMEGNDYHLLKAFCLFIGYLLVALLEAFND